MSLVGKRKGLIKELKLNDMVKVGVMCVLNVPIFTYSYVEIITQVGIALGSRAFGR